jgi:Skp family chaperone for outer membrane proteins
MKLEELVEFLNLGEVTSLDEVKEKFNSKYISRGNVFSDKDISSELHGRMFGGISTSFIRTAKEFGLDIPKEDFKEKKIEDVLKDTFAKMKDKYETEITEIKTKATEPEEAFKELEKKFQNVQQRTKEYKDLSESLKAELQNKDELFKSQINDFKLTTYKKDIESKVNWVSDIDIYKKRGLETVFNEKYKLVLNEDEVIITDTKGERLRNPDKAGDFYSPLEVLTKEAKEAGLIKTNPTGGQVVKKPQEFAAVQNQSAVRRAIGLASGR